MLSLIGNVYEGLVRWDKDLKLEPALAESWEAKSDLEWRFHFLLGAMVYTMANNGRIQTLTDGACDPSQVESALHYMIPFFAAGFRSRPVAASAAPKSRRRKRDSRSIA